jgi:outer membrane protein OmpA-like peptidoglycan-associated protein
VLLSGCSSNLRNAQPQPSPAVKGAAIGTVSGAVVGATAGSPIVGAFIGGITGSYLAHYLAKNETLVQKLNANGVQIVLVGDNLRLILPTERFFVQNSATLNANYYPVLDQIATFLAGLNKYVVTVGGFTDNIGDSMRNLALSRQQAQAIATYLWQHNSDIRLLNAVGYGEAMPIASNATVKGQTMNRRVEINLREINDDREQ